MQNVARLTTNTSGNSINSPSGLQVGLDDNCAPGGGATLLTYGSMSFPANLFAYGGRFIARDYIDFSANASGVEGVSMIAGRAISGTSNMNMGVCGGTSDTTFQIPYFRMVN